MPDQSGAFKGISVGKVWPGHRDYETEGVCPRCGGSGETLAYDVCPVCGGDGEIPALLEQEQRARLDAWEPDWDAIEDHDR